MNTLRKPVFVGALVVVLVAGGCQREKPPGQVSANMELLGNTLRVSGPYAHENLSVFLVHADKQDERDFLTLDEGLKSGLVKITEMEEASVGALQLDNQSDRPLYLQEGERLSGGKQDRTIIASLVIGPKSGLTSVPTFCIEQNRWAPGASGKEFGYTTNLALAPKGVRGAAKVEGSQMDVWYCVGVQKDTASTRFSAPNTNSSANEMLDAPVIKKISDEYASALKGALDGRSDAVGFAIAVNGQIEEVNVYPNHALLKNLLPRLVQSYAVQAVMLKDQPRAAQPLASADVARFMKEGEEKSAQKKNIDGYNDARIRELAGNKFECSTSYKDKVVHWQVMKKNGAEGGEARRAALGSGW